MREYHNLTGVYNLMAHAVIKSNDPGFASLRGDLNQMSIQADAMRAQGIEFGYSDVYPVVKTEDDFKRALKLFWDREVPGWWHYEKEMTQYGYCTHETFQAKLETYCARRHSD